MKKTISKKATPAKNATVKSTGDVKLLNSLLAELNEQPTEDVIVAENPLKTVAKKTTVVNVINKELENLNESLVPTAKPAEKPAKKAKKAEKVEKPMPTEPDFVALKKLIEETTFSQKKVKAKAFHLIDFLCGRAKNANTVIKIALETLKKDGYIETGEKGNLFQALLKKPYTKDTARAQSGQIIYMFPLLKFCTKEKDKLIATESVNYLYDKILLPREVKPV